MRAMLIFHAIGDYTPQQVRSVRVADTRTRLPEVDRAIDAVWAEARARLGERLFDGPMCRLEGWSAGPAELRLDLSRTTYRVFYGTNLSHPEFAERYGRSVMANPVGVSPALETADGWLMMGRRNASVAYYPNRVHPFAGALDPDDATVFDAISRELAEELAFTPADITEMRCTGVAEDTSIRQPELIFRATSPRTRAQIEKQVDREEHHDSWSIPATAAGVDDALKDAALLTPVACAALLLWGRTRFGEEWWTAQVRKDENGLLRRG